MLKKQSTSIVCKNCTNWDFLCTNQLLNFKPPVDYPKEHIPECGTICPKNITFESMSKAVVLTHENIVNNIWNQKSSKSYLKIEGLSSKIYDKITSQESLQLPSVWRRGTELKSYIDAPMHQLFLGIGKTVINDIICYMTKNFKRKYFFEVMGSENIKDIGKLSLDWCKLITFGQQSMGGWVSENIMAYCRIIKWLLQNFPTNKKKSLKYFKKPMTTEPEDAFHYIINLVYSFHAMISRLMTNKMDTNIQTEITRYIKIFLNRKNESDLYIYKMDNWSKKSNFVSLMNLSENAMIFGPIKLYWEGGPCGEKIIQMIKPLINGLTINWQKNTLLRFYRGNILKKCHLLQIIIQTTQGQT